MKIIATQRKSIFKYRKTLTASYFMDKWKTLNWFSCPALIMYYYKNISRQNMLFIHYIEWGRNSRAEKIIVVESKPNSALWHSKIQPHSSSEGIICSFGHVGFSLTNIFSFPRSHITHLYLSIFAKGRKHKLELMPALPACWQSVQLIKTDKQMV